MRLADLISFTENNFNLPSIIVPQFEFSDKVLNNVEFEFMGFSDSKGNRDKKIYMSKDILYKSNLVDLYRGGTCLGDSNIGRAATISLDNAIYNITGEHLKYYRRTFDNQKFCEKIFMPLECEVTGDVDNSFDEEIIENYPRWTRFSELRYFDKKYENQPCCWWLANKSKYVPSYCGIGGNGLINIYSAENMLGGVVLAFCI